MLTLAEIIDRLLNVGEGFSVQEFPIRLFAGKAEGEWMDVSFGRRQVDAARNFSEAAVSPRGRERGRGEQG